MFDLQRAPTIPLNKLLTLNPNTATAPLITTAISVAISAYSAEVTPRSSRTRRRSRIRRADAKTASIGILLFVAAGGASCVAARGGRRINPPRSPESYWSDRVGDLGEQGVQLSAERNDRPDARDRDQGHHEAILEQGHSAVVAAGLGGTVVE